MRLTTLLVATLVALPSLAMAQQQTCEQRAAIMGQMIEDMSRTRGAVSTAEIEAASLKVQIKTLQAELEQAKKASEKKADVKPVETSGPK